MESTREKILQLYKHCRELEKRFDRLNSADFVFLKGVFNELASADGPHTEKLATLASHIQNEMTLQTFQNILVPLERWLNRTVRDDEFLVRSEDLKKGRTHFPLIMVLDHLRSAFNVGAFFRLADGLGVEKIFLAGYTPTPGQLSVQKTALGAEDSVQWEWIPNLVDFLKAHQSTHHIISWETAENSVACDAPYPQKPTIFLFGNERFGLEKDRLVLSHEIREVKMMGEKNSLNVAQSAAIAAYEWRRQWLKSKSTP